MANIIENRLVAKGTDITPLLRVKEENASDFSFNNFVYQDPRLMAVAASSDITPALMMKISEGFTKDKDYLEQELLKYGIPDEIDTLITPDWFNVMYERYKAQFDEGKLEDLKDNAERYYANLLDFGYPSWYEWSIANWGTKWDVQYPSAHGDTLLFQTANSAPIPVIYAISKAYPEIEFEFTWADEDVTHNLGIVSVLNGEVISFEQPEAHTNRAFEIYQELHDDEYVVQDEDGNYSYQPD